MKNKDTESTTVVVYEPTGKPDNYNIDFAFEVLQNCNKALGRDLTFTEASFINHIVKRDSTRILATDGKLSVELVFTDLETGGVVEIKKPTLLTDEQKQTIAEAAQGHKRNVSVNVDSAMKIVRDFVPVKKSGKQKRRERRAKQRKNK